VIADDIIADVFEAFADFLSMEELQAVTEGATRDAMLASITGVTREEVLVMARDHAAQLVTRVSDQMIEQLAESIATGLEEQLGPEGTARLLRDGLGLDSNRAKTLENFRKDLELQGMHPADIELKVAAKRTQLINDRARTIARTEMGDALEEGARTVAKKRGATHKVWITVGDDRVDQDICAGNQGQGPIPIDEPFQSGHQNPTGHPSCRCTVSYVTDTGKGELGRAQVRAAERQGRLEAVYAEADAA